METSWTCSAYLEWQPLGTVKGIFFLYLFIFLDLYILRMLIVLGSVKDLIRLSPPPRLFFCNPGEDPQKALFKPPPNEGMHKPEAG